MRRCVWSRNLTNEEAVARVVPQRQRGKKNIYIILWANRRMCGTSLTETSLSGTWLYSRFSVPAFEVRLWHVLWPETNSDDVTDRPATLKNACPLLVAQLTCTARPSNFRHCPFRRVIRTGNTLKRWPAKGKNAWPRAVSNVRSFATVSETCCHCWQQPIRVSNDHLQSLTII